MSIANESVRAPTPIGTALHAGTKTISLDQKVSFDLYAQVILPLDGTVFWVKVSQLSQSALLNVMDLNTATLNENGVSTFEPQFTVQGSMHYATDSRQTEAANYSANRVVFTAQESVQNLNEIGQNFLYIATVDGPVPGSPVPPAGTTPIRFAFSSRSSYYKQADLWHYTGYAVYSTMDSQVIDDARLLNTRALIVSNSLPIFLAFNYYDPAWPVPVPRPRVLGFPSMLVPDNRRPPYVAFNIPPDSTLGVQMAPLLTGNSSHYQLGRERVEITLYGFNNSMAQDYLDALLQYSFDTELFGVLNSPFVMDQKEGQNELNTLAQKKRIVFEVSYNQSAVRNIARQLILTCVPAFYAGDLIIPT